MQKTPLQEIINGFQRKYGPRNNAFMQSRGEILLFHSNAMLVLSKQISAGNTSKRSLLASLGSVFSRTITLANSFGDLKIIQALSKKYPLPGCAYCGEKVYECKASQRERIQESAETAIQSTWSIKDWCKHLKTVYGTSNKERGIEFALSRLNEEIDEVSDTEFRAKYSMIVTAEDFREEIAKEFADVFAWIFAIANLLDVNLDGLAKAWAFKKCSDCKSNPCDCGPFKFFAD